MPLGLQILSIWPLDPGVDEVCVDMRRRLVLEREELVIQVSTSSKESMPMRRTRELMLLLVIRGPPFGRGSCGVVRVSRNDYARSQYFVSVFYLWG